MKPAALLKAGCTFLTCMLLQHAANAQLKIGGESPASLRGDAVMELASTKQGFLLPRVSQAALAQHPLDTAASGLIVYVKEQSSLFIRKNSSWYQLFDANNLTYPGLDLISGVAITSPAANQLLQYNGTDWVNWTPDFAKLAAAPLTGSILFADASGDIGQNNTAFFWDNTNARLGIGTNASLAQTLTVNGDVLLRGNVKQYFSAATDYYIGAGRNNNFSLVSAKSATPLRIGANGAIMFHTDGNADMNDAPQVIISDAGNMGVGETAPTSKLNVGGSFAIPVRTSAGNITLNETDYLVVMTAAGTVMLPAASTCPGRVYQVKNAIAANVVSVATGAADRFDRATGPSSVTLDNNTITGTGASGSNDIAKTYTFVSGGSANVWYVTSF